MKYIYPKLPAERNYAFFRIGGSGLANCLFVYAKAIVYATKFNCKIISPAWLNFTLGTYIRKEPDKRHYFNIFRDNGEISGLKKFFILCFNKCKKYKDTNEEISSKLVSISGIEDYFRPIMENQDAVKKYLFDHINPSLLTKVNEFNFENTIAVHVRLGDYLPYRRVPMEWYISKISNLNSGKRILLFSDGSEDELRPLLNLPNVERAFFGGAIQDIIAISKCSYLIGSDSSFSAWGAYLGQIPCVFYRLNFGIVLKDSSKQIIENKN